jgi:3-hydroxyisobutyrate dehydrogenase
MGPPAARNAQGSMMAAGPKALFDSVQEELAQMTGKLEFMGERADLAAIHKLFGNAAIIGLSGVIADVLTLAQASNVDGTDAIKLLGWLDLNAMVANRGGKMAKGDFTTSFELAMARKDLRLMLETTGSRPMAALPAVASRMDQLIAEGRSDEDFTVMAVDAVKRG